MNQTFTQRMAIRAYQQAHRDAIEQQRVAEATRAARMDFLAAMAAIAMVPVIASFVSWILPIAWSIP